MQEAVRVTGVPLLADPHSSKGILDTPMAEQPDLAPGVRTHNTRGRDTRAPVMVPGICAGLVVLVVCLVMVWRWARSLRRERKPPSQKKTFHGPLMPQSSARMPKVCLRSVSGSFRLFRCLPYISYVLMITVNAPKCSFHR
jgi:hypothetical protein